jgi:hypothetical protein
MPQQNRVSLKSYFLTGSKPTQNNFGDLIDSMINLKEDAISLDPTGNPVLSKGITIGNSTLDTVGTIRWSGSVFQFRDNAGWHDLSLTGGTSSQWTTIGANINLAAGNAGIGVAAGPTYKLEVNLNNSTGAANAVDTVRLGNAAIFADGSYAYISHRSQAATNTYALAQDSVGNVIINCAAGRSISLFEAGAVKASFSGGGLSIGSIPGVATTLLTVWGVAAKSGSPAWILASDKRVKKDITPFTDGLDHLKKLKPVNFKYNGKGGHATDIPYVGLIAQDVQEVLPYMVGKMKVKMEPTDEQETEILSLDVNALTYVMMNSIRELDNRLTKLETMNYETMISE